MKRNILLSTVNSPMGRLIGVCSVFFCLSMLLTGSGAAQTFFTEVPDEAIVFERFAEGAGGIAFGDYDNDGWPDAFLTPKHGSRFALLHNEGDGGFVDRTATIQTDIIGPWKGGVAFGDYDNDGDLDLFMPMGGPTDNTADENMLLRNDRGVLTNVTQEVGLTDVELRAYSHPYRSLTPTPIWLDYDRDGYLDLCVGSLGENKLYRNSGDGTFADVTEEAGLGPFVGGVAGLAAGDFNNDGWPDLYVGRVELPNRLYLNNGQGGFQEATTDEIGDTGFALRAAAGDVDNDGDLDIFQSNRGEPLLLLNLGAGQSWQVRRDWEGDYGATGLADMDNDGDLDLMLTLLGGGHFLFLNNGDGTFVDQTSQSGIASIRGAMAVSFGDYDLDGFLDVWLGQKLYHNNGNANHWLRVELVGRASNRSGIGARLIATAGNLQQMREILGGLGSQQDELVAHFGLGDATKVDALVIRWPSGLIQTLTDVAVDRKLVVTEGEGGTWEYYGPSYVLRGPLFTPEETLADGTMKTILTVEAVSVPFGEGELSKVTADLSPIGGSSEALMYDDGTHGDRTAGDGIYTLQTTVPPGSQTGKHDVKLTVEDNLSRTASARRSLVVYPGGDEYLYQDQMGPRWEVKVSAGELDLTASDRVHQGSYAQAINLQGEYIRYTFTDPDGLSTFGYTALEFWINPGTSSTEKAKLLPRTAGSAKYLKFVDDLGITLEPNAWQVVSIPLEDLGLVDTRLLYIQLRGIEGTFYIDDLGLVVAEYKLAETVATPQKVKADGTMSTLLTVQAVAAIPEPGAPPTVTVDLTPIGGESDAGMVDDGTEGDQVPGDGIYSLQTTVDPGIQNGRKELVITSTDRRLRVVRTHLSVGVLPVEDVYMYQDEVEAGWKLRLYKAETNPTSTEYVHSGSYAYAITLQTGGQVDYMVEDPDGLPTFGYGTLEFWINPGSASIGELKIVALTSDGGGEVLPLVEQLGLSFEPERWQLVSIPLAVLELTDAHLEWIRFVGDIQGTFYMDDMRFVPEEVEIPPVAVEEVSEATALPLGYSLAQNYPNPFNPVTTITYDLPQASHVTLTIYTITGQKVSVLVHAHQQAGHHRIPFDGSGFGTGIYLYRLEAGSFVETRRMVLLK